MVYDREILLIRLSRHISGDGMQVGSTVKLLDRFGTHVQPSNTEIDRVRHPPGWLPKSDSYETGRSPWSP